MFALTAVRVIDALNKSADKNASENAEPEEFVTVNHANGPVTTNHGTPNNRESDHRDSTLATSKKAVTAASVRATAREFGQALSVWVRSAATGSYLQTVSLQEIIKESTITDFHETDNPVKDVAKIAGLMAPIMLLTFAAWAGLVGVAVLFVITRS